MSCPYSPSSKKLVKCELYKENSAGCNGSDDPDFCGKFRTLEEYLMPLGPVYHK